MGWFHLSCISAGSRSANVKASDSVKGPPETEDAVVVWTGGGSVMATQKAALLQGGACKLLGRAHHDPRVRRLWSFAEG